MKNYLKKILVLGITFSTYSILAQVSNYSFTQTIGAYGFANTGSMVGTNMQDDDLTQVALPFAFKFNDTIYNFANVSSNGFISFGSQQLNTYKPISGLTQNIISPFGHDLVMGMVTTGDISAGSNTITNLTSTIGIQIGDSLFDFYFDFGGQNPVIIAINGNDIIVSVSSTNNNPGADLFILTGSIRQNVSGSAPNRICEFEYKNFSRFSVYNDNINFKVKLYETSNKIEFVYGAMQPGSILSALEIGLKGSSSMDFNSRVINSTNSWVNSSASAQITDSCDFSQFAFPPFNLLYQWTPLSCAQPTLKITKSNTMICVGQTATLTASGASSYSWSTGATSNSIIISPATSSSYSVIGATGSCSSTMNVQQTVSKCTSIEASAEIANSIKIYPNPFQTELVIESTNEKALDYRLSDISGSIITSGQLNGFTTEKIRIENLQTGIYLLMIRNENSSITKKVIKE